MYNVKDKLTQFYFFTPYKNKQANKNDQYGYVC